MKRFGVTEKLGEFYIPSLWSCDDELRTIEIDYMHSAPYVVDFGKVRLFKDPEFSEEVLRDADVTGRERFGDNWPRVQQLLRDFESFLIYYLDPKPGNIVFEGDLEQTDLDV